MNRHEEDLPSESQISKRRRWILWVGVAFTLLPGAGFLIWRLNQPLRLIPVAVEVIVLGPGMVFYLDDEFVGEDEVRLTASNRTSLSDAQLQLSAPTWSPNKVLATLYPDEQIDALGTMTGSAGSGSTGLVGAWISTRMEVKSALFRRGEQLDEFFLASLEVTSGTFNEFERVGPWKLRAIRGQDCRLDLSSPTTVAEPVSEGLERWLLGRIRYNITVTVQASVMPRPAYPGSYWIDAAEAARAKSK